MSSYSHDSKPCCTIPPVVNDYQPKGSMTKRAGMECYEVNPSSQKAILAVFDVFGYHNSTKQGADALAELGFHVLMPNFFNGPGLSEEEFQNGKIMEFITSKGPPPVKAQEALDLGKALKAEGKTSVGLYGLCWGGKVVTLVGSKDDSPFSGVASIHPAMVEPTDFQSLKQPIGFFPSADEPTDAVNKSWEVIKGTPVAGKSVFKHYTDQHHGFAGARAKLGEASNVAAFEDLYRRLGDFFKNVTN